MKRSKKARDKAEMAVEFLNKVDLSKLTIDDCDNIQNGYLQNLVRSLFEEECDLSEAQHQNHNSHANHSQHAQHSNVAIV